MVLLKVELVSVGTVLTYWRVSAHLRTLLKTGSSLPLVRQADLSKFAASSYWLINKVANVICQEQADDVYERK